MYSHEHSYLGLAYLSSICCTEPFSHSPQTEDIKSLIGSKKQVLLYADYENRYPIHVAIERSLDIEMLECLIDDQRNILTTWPEQVFTKSEQCFTPLHHFLQHSKTYDVEKMMLLMDESKTVLYMPDGHGEVPLHYAIRHGSKFPHVIPMLIDVDKKCLLECGGNGCPLQLAVLSKWDVNMLSVLIDPLKKVFRLHGYGGETPLHASIRFKSDDATVRFLVESDPYVLKTQNSDQCTPLHTAIDNKMSDYCPHDCTKLYNEWGIDMIFLLAQTDTSVLTLQNIYGDTALSSAVKRGMKVEVLQHLIDSEGNVLSKSTEYRCGRKTPLHKSIIATSQYKLSEDTIRLLVEHEGGEDALVLQDRDGNTPLHAAVNGSLSLKIIQLLASKSMPPGRVARNGRVMPTLEYQYALIMENNLGKTPLHMAMCKTEITQNYDTVLCLVQIDATVLGKICYHQSTPLTMSVIQVLKNVMPVSVLEILVRSYPPGLVVNDPRDGCCKFPLVCALETAADVCALDVDTLIQVLGMLIDGDGVVMRRHGFAPTPSELAIANNWNPRVVEFLRRYESRQSFGNADTSENHTGKSHRKSCTNRAGNSSRKIV